MIQMLDNKDKARSKNENFFEIERKEREFYLCKIFLIFETAMRGYWLLVGFEFASGSNDKKYKTIIT